MSDAPPVKKQGHCTLCGERVFDIVSIWPDSAGAMAGFPRRCGTPGPAARRARFEQASLAVVDLTFGDCENCTEAKLAAKGTLKRIHRCICDTNRFYLDRHQDLVALGVARPYTQEQLDAARNECDKLRANPLSRLLRVQLWSEVLEDEG
jgi:hypothetical protein